MQITINTAEPLSDLDVKVLGVLLGEETAEAAPKAAAPAPAKKAAPKAAPKAEKAPEPEPEDDADEDLVGGDDDSPTMEDAVALATKLVQGGQAAKVKAALAEVGVKKVSEIKAGDLATFVNTLS